MAMLSNEEQHQRRTRRRPTSERPMPTASIIPRLRSCRRPGQPTRAGTTWSSARRPCRTTPPYRCRAATTARSFQAQRQLPPRSAALYIEGLLRAHTAATSRSSATSCCENLRMKASAQRLTQHQASTSAADSAYWPQPDLWPGLRRGGRLLAGRGAGLFGHPLVILDQRAEERLDGAATSSRSLAGETGSVRHGAA